MAFTQAIRSSLSRSVAARARAGIMAGIALSVAAGLGCTTEQLTANTDPDILNIEDYNTPAGATPLRVGVIGNFNSAFDGGQDSFVTMTGNMSDELIASDTFDGRLTINARKSVEINSEMEGVYRSLHRVRAGAARAAIILATTAPEPKFNRGELYMYLGFSEDFFGEGWCSGVPFSKEDGQTTAFGQALTTQQMFETAVAHFDTALTMADTSKKVRYGAQIGKARALLNLGKYSEASTAVDGVPQTFKLVSGHSANSNANGMWTATTNGTSRYRLSSGEGTNGLPFLSTPRDTNEKRIPWSASSRVGFSSQFTQMPNQSKFGQYTDGIVADGIEAVLIRLEARLQGNTQADRDAVYGGLNTLRATGLAQPLPTMTTGAPTAQAAAVDLFFKERAYWLWLTGHRLGDMRRLVRNYARDVESVFPTGTLTSPLIGTYGTSTSVTVPFAERNNPNFKGCLEGK